VNIAITSGQHEIGDTKSAQITGHNHTLENTSFSIARSVEFGIQCQGEASTDGGGNPNRNTIGCEDSKWLETLNRQRIELLKAA
jgi:hypothetical protein